MGKSSKSTTDSAYASEEAVTPPQAPDPTSDPAVSTTTADAALLSAERHTVVGGVAVIEFVPDGGPASEAGGA